MIILKCVKEGGKLRIKFHCFINGQNQRYTNVYNNSYNCKFPKDVRRDGAYYKVNDTDIRLAMLKDKPFYSIKTKNILVMTEAEIQTLLNPTIVDLSTMQIFDAGDCVICLSAESAIVFIPCAHRCVCSQCNDTLTSRNYICPVCRGPVQQSIIG
jgi:hypothetical protein